MPTAALADEILTPGKGQVKALFVVGGNPMLSWPNQAKTRRALESLDLLVAVDPQLSATARMAHYVIGPRFGFETPAVTFGNEGITTYGLSLGYQEPYAQYQPQLVEPPPGSEVFEDWRIFYELGRAMGLQLAYRGHAFDMVNAPTTDALLEQFVGRSRVPLAQIKQYPHGHLFPDPQPLAAAREEAWPYRLELGHPAMLRELAEVESALPHADSGLRRPELDSIGTKPADPTAPDLRVNLSGPAPGSTTRAADATLELLLVSRREHAVYNSVGQHLPALRRRRPFNPAYMNPADAARIGVADDATVVIESAAGSIRAVVQCAPDVRQGVVSLAHGFEPTTGGRARREHGRADRRCQRLRSDQWAAAHERRTCHGPQGRGRVRV